MRCIEGAFTNKLHDKRSRWRSIAGKGVSENKLEQIKNIAPENRNKEGLF